LKLGQDKYSYLPFDLKLVPPCSANQIESVSGPKRFCSVDRHKRSPEILVVLAGQAIVCLAPAQEIKNNTLHGLRAVRIQWGDAFIIELGAWHSTPRSVGNNTALLLTISRIETELDDLHRHVLPQIITLLE
jgi:mannose-6-phosphate isomerase-like protein (cupin superfamily)